MIFCGTVLLHTSGKYCFQDSEQRCVPEPLERMTGTLLCETQS